MHFTLWPSARANEGGHAEITWESFLSFVSSPQVAASKDALEGWSPVRFAGNRRAKANVELVSCIVLDDDASGLPLEQVLAAWSAFAGVVHTTHSHTTEAPKYRIVLRCSRDVTAAEHARVWRWVRDFAARAGQTLDEVTKDASRLWFVPAHREGAPYAWAELPGAALDVDAILMEAEHDHSDRRDDRAIGGGVLGRFYQPAVTTPSAPAAAPADRRAAMAAALGAAWPAKGRHAAQLALAGALRAEGWPAEEALEFLCAVCRAAGDEDRPKREATIRHTYGRPADAPLTGWSRLKSHVDPVVVDAARGALGRDAGWTESVNRRLAEAAGAAVAATDGVVIVDGLRVETAGLDAPLAPIDYQVDGLIARGDVVMFVAHGNSLKTWVALSMVLAIASGRPWLGHYATKRGRACVLDFESGRYEVARRFKLLGARDGDTGDRLMRVSYPLLGLVDPSSWTTLAKLRPDILLIDSFGAANRGQDENDARAADVLGLAGEFAESTGCTVAWIHHSRKHDSGDARESVRGSTALFAACDRIFKFDDLEKRDGGTVLVTMRAVKDGAGRTPPPVRVELTDDGLRYVDISPPPEKTNGDANRELAIRTLKASPAGVAKNDLLNVLKGKNDSRREVVSSLLIANIAVEYRERVGRSYRSIVMLNPALNK